MRVEIELVLNIWGINDVNLVPSPVNVFFLYTESSNEPFECLIEVSRKLRVWSFSSSEVNCMFLCGCLSSYKIKLCVRGLYIHVSSEYFL